VTAPRDSAVEQQMTHLDYVLGMLWVRGTVDLTAHPQLMIRISVRDVEPWQIEVLNSLQSGEIKEATVILSDPSVAAYANPPHNLTYAQVDNYLDTLKQLAVPIVKKIGAGWQRRKAGRFDTFLKEKIHDRNNYLQVQNQIQILTTQLQAELGAVSGPGSSGPFHIANSVVTIPLAPAIMKQITTSYSIPTTGPSVDLAFEMTEIPPNISNGRKKDQWDFLQGIADVCGTLEGVTVRGVDARVKFDLLTNSRNLSKYRASVEKVCNLCHFIQFCLRIPLQATNLSKSNNARPHKPKIWVGDFVYYGYDPGQWPLWRIKTHYQQRLLQAAQRYTAHKSDFHPTKKDVDGTLSYVQGTRPTYPSYCLNINYCAYLRTELNKIPTLPGTDFVTPLKKKLARDLKAEGAVLP